MDPPPHPTPPRPPHAGPGNTPAIIDETANIELAVSSILLSKTFDNGVICASEQSVVIVASVYDKVRAEFAKRGAWFLNEEDKAKVCARLQPCVPV